MYSTQLPYVELYQSILEYDGSDIYSDILEHWQKNNTQYCQWIEDFRSRTNNDWAATNDEELCRLYALFRITSTLLLLFQLGRADGSEYRGPEITVEGFQLFHEQLGFVVSNTTKYHPFFHEIISVDQSPNKDSPIQLIDCAWPSLMLGDLLYCRAGCTVSAGLSHVVKEIAEHSQLYWTYRRKDRPYSDRSHGWGSNSQWRTQHRRDYRTANHYHFNVDGRESLNDPHCVVYDVPIDTMIELVRHRGLVRLQAIDSDLYPYIYSYTESIE